MSAEIAGVRGREVKREGDRGKDRQTETDRGA